MRFCILLLVGLAGCSDGDKNAQPWTDSGSGTYDTSDFLYKKLSLICYYWATEVCYATAMACGDPHTNGPSDCESACYDDKFDHCLATVYALPDPGLAVLVMEDACPHGSSANYLALPDCSNTIVTVDACDGVVQAGVNWQSTIQLVDTCPCLLTNEVTYSATYATNVCAE